MVKQWFLLPKRTFFLNYIKVFKQKRQRDIKEEREKERLRREQGKLSKLFKRA